jgi:hypothetical protein
MKNKTIAMIIPYYGKFPWYFNLFLHSASYNPSVDILIFTDLERPVYCPDNVHFIKMSLSEFCQLASQKLKLDIEIHTPYKICDFKPAYGLIFGDFIKEYDFWGIGDIDIIYGNIRHFMTEDLLSTYDFISVRDDYVTGFFSLFRNTETMNTLFMKSKDYVKVFSKPAICGFDEFFYHFYNLIDRDASTDEKEKLESMTYIVKKYNDEKLIKAHFDFMVVEGIPGNLMWDNGILSYMDKYEALLYHLISFKRVNKEQNVEYESIPDVYHIDRDKIRQTFNCSNP